MKRIRYEQSPFLITPLVRSMYWEMLRPRIDVSCQALRHRRSSSSFTSFRSLEMVQFERSSVASPHSHVCNLFIAGLFHPMQNGAITITDLRAGMKEHITHHTCHDWYLLPVNLT